MQHPAQCRGAGEIVLGEILWVDELPYSTGIFHLADHPHRRKAGHTSLGPTRNLADTRKQPCHVGFKSILVQAANINRTLDLALWWSNAPGVDVI